MDDAMKERILEAVQNGVPIYNPIGSFIRREETTYVHQGRCGTVRRFAHAEGAVESFIREEYN